MAESLSKFYQLKDNDLTVANEFRDQVKFLFGEGLSDDETIAAIKARRWDQNQSNRFVMAIKETLSQGKLSDDEAIAKIKELSEQSQLLGEITDILNRANTECLDHRRFKQEEKIVLTGFRGLCDIHAALFKKRSEYEIYGSRIINDLLNHEFTQFALEVKQLLIDSVGKDISNEEAIAEIKRLQQSTQPIDILEMSVNANEIREKEFDVLLEEVTKLKSDLRIAKKVIARLVGE